MKYLNVFWGVFFLFSSLSFGGDEVSVADLEAATEKVTILFKQADEADKKARDSRKDLDAKLKAFESGFMKNVILLRASGAFKIVGRRSFDGQTYFEAKKSGVTISLLWSKTFNYKVISLFTSEMEFEFWFKKKVGGFEYEYAVYGFGGESTYFRYKSDFRSLAEELFNNLYAEEKRRREQTL